MLRMIYFILRMGVICNFHQPRMVVVNPVDNQEKENTVIIPIIEDDFTSRLRLEELCKR